MPDRSCQLVRRAERLDERNAVPIRRKKVVLDLAANEADVAVKGVVLTQPHSWAISDFPHLYARCHAPLSKIAHKKRLIRTFFPGSLKITSENTGYSDQITPKLSILAK